MTLVDVAGRGAARRPGRRHGHRSGRRAGVREPRRPGRRVRQGDRRPRAPGERGLRRQHHPARRRRRLGRVRRPAAVGRRRRARRAGRRSSSAATREVRTVAASLGGDLVRLVETAEYAGPGGSVEQLGLYFVDAGQHIEHRLFVDHNAPADPQQRRLPRRAAGRGCALGLDRRRADPQGRRGHRDLRVQPQPRPHRRLPRRLRAQPRDRDRRHRRGRATPRRPVASTTSSCSTCAAAASTRPRPVAWSCTASSPTSSGASASRASSSGCSQAVEAELAVNVGLPTASSTV